MLNPKQLFFSPRFNEASDGKIWFKIIYDCNVKTDGYTTNEPFIFVARWTLWERKLIVIMWIRKLAMILWRPQKLSWVRERKFNFIYTNLILNLRAWCLRVDFDYPVNKSNNNMKSQGAILCNINCSL